MNKMYEMIIDEGTDVFKFQRLGKSTKDIQTRYSGNGEFVRVKDVTEESPLSVYAITTALKQAGFGDMEINAVAHLVRTGYANVIE